MCSPSWFHQRHGSDQTYDLSVYTDDGMWSLCERPGTTLTTPGSFRNVDGYFDDLGQAYRAEVSELYYLGCRE